MPCPPLPFFCSSVPTTTFGRGGEGLITSLDQVAERRAFSESSSADEFRIAVIRRGNFYLLGPGTEAVPLVHIAVEAPNPTIVDWPLARVLVQYLRLPDSPLARGAPALIQLRVLEIDPAPKAFVFSGGEEAPLVPTGETDAIEISDFRRPARATPVRCSLRRVGGRSWQDATEGLKELGDRRLDLSPDGFKTLVSAANHAIQFAGASPDACGNLKVVVPIANRLTSNNARVMAECDPWACRPVAPGTWRYVVHGDTALTWFEFVEACMRTGGNAIDAHAMPRPVRAAFESSGLSRAAVMSSIADNRLRRTFDAADGRFVVVDHHASTASQAQQSPSSPMPPANPQPRLDLLTPQQRRIR